MGPVLLSIGEQKSDEQLAFNRYCPFGVLVTSSRLRKS